MTSPCSLNNSDDILAFLRRHPKLIFADDFELTVQHENSQRRDYLDGNPVRRDAFEGFWVGIRLLHRKRPGWAATSDMSTHGLRLAVDQALHSADLSSMDPWFRFPLWKPHPVSGQPVENGQYDSLATHVSRVPIGFEEAYSTHAVRTILARKSEKYELRSFQNAHEAKLSIQSMAGAEEPASIREQWSHRENVSDRGKRLERMSIQAAVHATLDRRKALYTDAQDLVLAPNVAANWIWGLVPSLGGTEVARGRTFWSSCSGPLSPAFTLIDDGKLADIPHATGFDLEGAATQRTLLIDKGERRSLLHDSYSSARENRMSTGNSIRRSDETRPSIQPWHLSVEGGPTGTPWSSSSLVAYIDEVSPRPTGLVSRSSAKWERVLAGLLVRRGEPVARIRPFKVSWPYAEMLRGITAMDNSSQMFGNVTTPSIWWEKMPK